VSGDEAGTIRFWNMETGREERVLSAHDDVVSAVRFSPNGALFASSAEDATLRLWDSRSGKLVAELRGHDKAVTTIGFSRDGARLFSSGADSTLRMWDVASARCVQVFATGSAIGQLAVSPDGAHLVTAGLNGTVKLWDLRTGRDETIGPYPYNTFLRHGFRPAFSADGARLYVPGIDESLYVHELQTGADSALEKVGRVYDLSPDARWAVTLTQQTLNVVSLEDGIPLWRGVGLSNAGAALTHRGWQLERADEFGPNLARSLASNAVSFTRAEDVVCVEEPFGHVSLWKNDQKLAVQQVSRVVRAEAFPGGCIVIRLLASPNGEADESFLLRPDGRFEKLPYRVSVAAWVNGALLLAAEKTVRVLDRDLHEQSAYPIRASAWAVSQNDDTIAAGFVQGGVTLISKSGREVPALELQPSRAPHVIAFGPGHTLIVGYGDGGLGIWSTIDGSRLDFVNLSGDVSAVRVVGDDLFALTSRGDTFTMSLAPLTADYCDLLREVWGKMPLLWNEGRLATSPAPRDHRCAR
jgi:WD40 repeat protein